MLFNVASLQGATGVNLAFVASFWYSSLLTLLLTVVTLIPLFRRHWTYVRFFVFVEQLLRAVAYT